MTAAVRKTPTVPNGGDRTGANYLLSVDTEIEALWKVVLTWLVSIGGTGNAITASSDTSLVAAIAAYAKPMGFYYVPTAANSGAATINIDSIGVIAIKDKNGAALQGGEFALGSLYPLIFDGTNFRAITIAAGAANTVSTAPDIILQDQKSSGTNGGTFTSGAWRTRDLNTLVRNNNALGSLATNQLTLPAGTYYAEWSAPAHIAGHSQTRLTNATDSTVIGYGTTAYDAGLGVQVDSRGCAVFTITSNKAFQVEHRCSSSESTDGFGMASAFGNIEVYAELRIWKQ